MNWSLQQWLNYYLSANQRPHYGPFIRYWKTQVRQKIKLIPVVNRKVRKIFKNKNGSSKFQLFDTFHEGTGKKKKTVSTM